MIEYLFTGAIVCIVLFIYSCIIQPKARLKNLAQGFEAKGFKVKSIPYACLGAPVQKQFSVKDGDAMAWIKK